MSSAICSRLTCAIGSAANRCMTITPDGAQAFDAVEVVSEDT